MTAMANAGRTARERARAELTREITEEARRQLAAHGPAGLSLRAVARALGMVSSAIYRYFPSRDELLTALIIDAYDALGSAAEAADAAVAATDIRGRWHAACAAVRTWAVAHPHEYALIYGSPVPGYQAPQATVPSAIRVVRVMGRILADAVAGAGAGAGAGARGANPVPSPPGPVPWPPGPVPWPPGPVPSPPGPVASPPGLAPPQRPLPPPLAEQTVIVADAIAPGVPGPVIARALIAWTQLFGMVSFELFGQFVGSLEPADCFFGYAVEQMADFIGLPGRSPG
jgi:AcrR family transcriptional regulator